MNDELDENGANKTRTHLWDVQDLDTRLLAFGKNSWAATDFLIRKRSLTSIEMVADLSDEVT